MNTRGFCRVCVLYVCADWPLLIPILQAVKPQLHYLHFVQAAQDKHAQKPPCIQYVHIKPDQSHQITRGGAAAPITLFLMSLGWSSAFLITILDISAM